MEDRLQAFIERHKLDIDTSQYETECERFIESMERGLKGEEKQLPMIPTYISDAGEVPKNQKIITIDAGGTNLRIATVYFDDDLNPVIENFTKYAMPGIEREVTAEELLETITDYLMPVIEESDNIGFCFSYAAEVTSDRDAIVVELAKEVKVSGLCGQRICAELQKCLTRRGVGKKRFTLLNDTVATQVAGKTATPGRGHDGYLGFILGTGTNICYTEQNRNIEKLPSEISRDGEMVINVESGMYRGYDRGDIDIKLDQESENPGSHQLEKMVSGAYLGQVIRRVFLAAIDEGLFSEPTAKKIRELEEIKLYYTDRFYEDHNTDNPLADCFRESEADLAIGVTLIDHIMRRAAYLNAIVYGATLIKADAGKDRDAPALICAEGTTFYKTPWFRDHFFPMTEELVTKRLGRYFEIAKVEDATLIGTAVAGLIN